MSVQIIGNAGTVADTDTNRNVLSNTGISAHPSAGGYYSVAGGTTAVIAATLAASTPLMTMRFSASSTRKAYVYKFRTLIAVATLAAAPPTIAGTIGLQRFNAATPTGGNARTVNEENEPLTTGTDMTDVRDSNAALTVTSVVFGSVVAQVLVPTFITSGAGMVEWIIEPPYPIVLQAGDGLSLRTQVVMPATQTWMFSYAVYWSEA